MDFSQILTSKSDAIIDRWVEAVSQDQQIEATQELTYKAVRDSLPQVLQALSTVLSESEANDLQMLVEASLEHGRVRADQGFEPAEIAREYRLLRFIIFSTLEDELLKSHPTELLRAIRLIDMVIDEAIARCFDSYTQGRIQELKQLQGQLNMTNQELTRLVRASRDNLSTLAHELKTPLTSIIGYADTFLRQQRQQTSLKDTPSNFESIERVLRSGRLLLRLINDALEISRYDAGQMKLQLVSTSITELIDSVLEIVTPLIQSKNLALEVNIDRAPAQVVTDPLRLQQILTNLLSNATRYTESGFIRVQCQTLADQRWSITIADSGIGISAEAQTHIFEPYFQETRATDSTGLGLAIVARLVRLLQGEIQVRSEVDRGSSFTVIFPLEIRQARSH